MNRKLISLFIFLLACLCACRPAVSPTPKSTSFAPPKLDPTNTIAKIPAPINPDPTSEPVEGIPANDRQIPYDLVSLESLISSLEELTAIEAYSGWRNGGSQGEAQALDYMESKLKGFAYLNESGLEIERQTFPVHLAVEIWEARLHLEIDGQVIEAPANGLRGSRYESSLALNFDSDGVINDSENDPLITSGPILIIHDPDLLYSLKDNDILGKVIFLDYAIIDRVTNRDAGGHIPPLIKMLSYEPAGLVLVTEYSNQNGKSRGTLVGDGSIFQYTDFNPKLPVLHIRVEDMADAGITTWEDLAGPPGEMISTARLTWDADVFSPGWSGNLAVRIPGADSTAAMILGAHIDSPNGPGAFDDGSGSVVLLEIARILETSQFQPPVDLYLVWFGSHELGIYGSGHFASTHQDLLDRTLAMLEIDCLGYPMENHKLNISLNTWTYGKFGDDRPTFPDYLDEVMAVEGIDISPYIEYGLISDNSNFAAFDVPNADLIYINNEAYMPLGSMYLHYAAHLHDPYETADLASDVGDVLVDMTRTALAAALQTGLDKPELRVTSPPEKRAVLLANHTQPPDVATTFLIEMGMALSWQGFDVDLIPYGETITPDDLTDVSLVVILPELDYLDQPDIDWAPEELETLDTFVENGGLLLVSNSYRNFAMTRPLEELNEDLDKINILTERFGVSFINNRLSANLAKAEAEHPLMELAGYLEMIEGNGVPFTIDSGIILALADGEPAIALVDYGDEGGQVLIVADIGILFDYGRGGRNLAFLKNLAAYAWER